MELQYSVLKDKIAGCWIGKNAGGVLGEPFEGKRQENHVEFYVQDFSKSGIPANDDLDLQLVWLWAAERHGRALDAALLGEYWLSYITPAWVEYGTGKANLRKGLLPPLSGHVENGYRNSCGAFIRSEIWACLFPGNPEQAARMAYEDAIVDHGDEGMYGEIFCAALQSAAFVEGDLYELIEIGLSYLPEDCCVAQAVRFVAEHARGGTDLAQMRGEIMTHFPGSFGVQTTKLADIPAEYPVAQAGYDAPNNLAIMITALLYGGRDFGKSLCIAVSFGEDTDCTAATVGAILGILAGASGLPKKWTAPLGRTIRTCCINQTSLLPHVIPKTTDELTKRILRLIPVFNRDRVCSMNEDACGFTVRTLDKGALRHVPAPLYTPMINGCNLPKELPLEKLFALSPYVVKYSFPALTVLVDYVAEPVIYQNTARTIRISVMDTSLAKEQRWVNATIYTDPAAEIVQGRHFSLPLQNTYGYAAEFCFDVVVSEFTGSTCSVLVNFSVEGRHTSETVKITLLPNRPLGTE